MTALISIGRHRHEFRESKSDTTPANWKRQVLAGIVNWLTEPITFPGKWPVIDREQGEYNRGGKGIVVHERSAPRPRCLAGSRARQSDARGPR